MNTLSDKNNDALAENVISEKFDQKKLISALALIDTLNKIIAPVGTKMPKTLKAIAKAKSIIKDESAGGALNALKGALTPKMLKPVTKYADAIGFIAGLSQALVQASQVFTTLSDIPENELDIPLINVSTLDKKQTYNHMKAAVTPDGVLGFLRGMPLVNDKIIVGELIKLSSNDFKNIGMAVNELTKKKEDAKNVTKAAKDAEKMENDIKNDNKTIAKPAPEQKKKQPAPKPEAPVQTPAQASAPQAPKQPNANDEQKQPPMRAFSKKNYADGLFTAVRKDTKITPEQIKKFVDNVAAIIEKQGIKIEESKSLASKFGNTLLKEGLTYQDFVSAAQDAGITDEDDMSIIIFKLGKMMAGDRVTATSGMVPKIFPADFKFQLPPAGNKLHNDRKNARRGNEAWDKLDAEKDDALERFKHPTITKASLPVVKDPWGAKGNYIPLMGSPSNIIIQGRDLEQEMKNDDDYEYSDISKFWFINYDELKKLITKYEESIKQPAEASTEDVQPDDVLTKVQSR